MKIRVLTYNIHKGFNSFGNQFILKEIKKSLLETKADLLLLQEVVGENLEHAENIEEWPDQPQFEFLADTVWHHYSYGKNAIFPNRHHGNALLSKFPVVFDENLNISNNSFEKRGLLHCTIEIPKVKKQIHVFNTHIDLLSSGRRKQIQKIKDRILSHTKLNDTIILTGDFNDWAEEATTILEDAIGLNEAHTVIHGLPAKTFPSFMPFLALDRIYFRGLKAVACQRLERRPWNKLSDHIPLLADFEIV